MNKKIIFTLFSLILISGCVGNANHTQNVNIAPEPDWSNPFETQKMVITEKDEFTKLITITGPNAINNEYRRITENYKLGQLDLFIRAWREPNKSVISYQIYIHSEAVNWRHFQSAYDSDGNKLDMIIIANKVFDCYPIPAPGVCAHEHVGVNVSEEYLRNKINTGIRFKLIGEAGDEVYVLSGPYIHGFLSAVTQQ